MKAKLLDITGKEKGSIDLPKAFSTPVREDLVLKIIEIKKTEQPYAPSPVAGNQASASGKLNHRRHVWKSQYGRGMSRIPRKRMSRRGTQFNWVGATVPSTRGGRRAHPPKVSSRINTLSVNKKELVLAFCSALSATISTKWLKKKYSSLQEEKLSNLPLIFESKVLTLKTKEMVSTLNKVLGEKLSAVAFRTKDVRSGRGKLRGRKYKTNAGMLMVVGNNEKLKTTAFEVASVKTLGVNDLANGGLGRLTVYTEQAIKDLGEKIK
jgi:large subunit ribosomal protein L4e